MGGRAAHAARCSVPLVLRRPGRRQAGRTVALLSLALSSCAPHLVAPPRLEPLDLFERYRARLGAREALARAADAEASAWVKGDSIDLPGVHARLAIGAPDAFRVRVESLFGVALDFAAWGDSVACFVPSRRQGLALDAAVDSLGVRSPGALGARLLAATWDPPATAWGSSGVEDSLVVVAWRERGDSLALGVGSDGTPRWVERRDARGAAARARYRAWETVQGTRWPVHLELVDRAAGVTVTLRLTRVVRNISPAPGRLVVRMPGDTRRLEWAALREALARGRRP